MTATDLPPCSCFVQRRPGSRLVRVIQFDPFCPRDERHRKLAVTDFEPEYIGGGL